MRKIWKIVLPVFVLLIAVVIYINYPRLNIITGFAAKNACSCIFEAGRDLESVKALDNNFSPVNQASYKVDTQKMSVTSRIFGLKPRTAVYHRGLGCVLLPEKSSEISFAIIPERTIDNNSIPYPYGNAPPKDSVFLNVDTSALQMAVENAFDREGSIMQQTRAVVVLYKGHLIAEKYGEGFNAETSLLGWSMTKSITSAVLGRMEKQGRVSLDQNNLFEEWAGDERSKITLNDLLQMNSGLEWVEDYETISDVTRMLFQEKDMTRVQLRKPMAGPRSNTWNYSSGTTNLLSGFIRNQFDTHQEYLDYWYKEVIDKIGMHSMTLETDAAGNYVGSSYAWATARDWAKFGQLYLNRGKWNGEVILSESWINYSATPVEGSNGEYGAHFWLNAWGKYPNVPGDLYSANGFQGQHVFIIPSKELVVVRFGLAEYPDFDVDSFLKNIIGAVREF
ncbi:serine hydrolase [Antarcticibacterium arcticum]|uniref:Serine hydrolase n=1 Tax=Antarcticibacterium arcticum TaxID=2585771 RepID=A0A5B8YIF7_9FLAO|nr:serine hydrolase [Antarcticibacterium arcticum]QED37712.1 serine hydrolase [Antarcticibacterium arcticum]